MAEPENYIELRFTNAMLLDIFSRYASNSDMAEFVDENGSVYMRFRMVNGVLEPPKNCEEVLSMLYILFETNPHSPAGRVYAAHQTEILRETVFRLSVVLESFSDVRMTISYAVPDEKDPSNSRTTHTEFTLTRTKTTHSEIM